MTRAVRYLRFDNGLEGSDDRIDRLLSEFRPRFSALASQRIFRGRADGESGPGFRLTAAGIAALLVPLLAIFGLLVFADVGGIRRFLLPPDGEEERLTEPDHVASPEWEAPPSPHVGDGSSDGHRPGPDRPEDADAARRIDEIIESGARRIAESWQQASSLPSSDSVLGDADRSLLARRTGIRARFLPSGTQPERLAAGLFAATILYAEPTPEEAASVRAILGAREPRPGFLLLVALRAVEVWRLGGAGKDVLALVSDSSLPAAVRTAAARALPATYSGEPLSGAVAVATAPDLPEETRLEFLLALGRIEGDEAREAIEALVEGADRADVRLGAIRLLAERIRPDSVEEILRPLPRFEDPRDQVRVLEVARGIGGHHALIYLVQEVLGFGSYPEVVLLAAVDVAASIARRLDALEELRPVSANAGLPASVRASAAAALPGRTAGTAIVERLRAGGDPERAEAAEMLRYVTNAPGRAEALTAALADPSPEVRRRAALALGRTGPRPREALAGMVASDPSPEVRAAAALALASEGVDLARATQDPTVLRIAIEEILSEPVPDSEWKAFAAAEAHPDPYGRSALRFQPRRFLEEIRRGRGLPIEYEPDDRVSELLDRSVAIQASPPFLSRREFLAEMLAPAGLSARVEAERLVVGLGE